MSFHSSLMSVNSLLNESGAQQSAPVRRNNKHNNTSQTSAYHHRNVFSAGYEYSLLHFMKSVNLVICIHSTEMKSILNEKLGSTFVASSFWSS